MFAGHLHRASPNPAIAVRNAVRVAGALLCLATVALLAVALRLGVYEYFHGEGRVFAWLWNALAA